MNILIVDDQPNVISSLMQRIPWHEVGISNVYTANSAAIAREILSHKQVDILLADIEMPQENGLTLVEWIRSTELEIECILLTSHANFYYAQLAISLEICDYVIQPASTESIVRALEKAKQKILQRRQRSREFHYNRFLSSAQNTVIRNFLESFPLDPRNVPEVSNQLEELGLQADWEKGIFLVLAKLNRWTKLPPPFPEFFEEYQSIFQQKFAFLQVPILSFFPNESFIHSVIFSGSQNEQEIPLRALQQDILDKSGCHISLFYCISKLEHLHVALRAVTQAAEKADKQDNRSIRQVISNQDYQQLSPSRNYEKYMGQLREFVSTHISQPLTRDYLSKELGISPDHLSHVVYQSVGCSLKSYITQERMRQGRELLRTTDMSIGEISAACGYDSPAYFSKVFRDTYHHSPSEERKL